MMRRSIASTSLETYHSLSIKGYLQPKEREVMAIFNHEDIYLTREEIAQCLGWKESAVCGRVNSLVTKNELEEVRGGKTTSGRPAKLLRLPLIKQRGLF